jgi:hypothetical protein
LARSGRLPTVALARDRLKHCGGEEAALDDDDGQVIKASAMPTLVVDPWHWLTEDGEFVVDACVGLMWVVKTADDGILAHCLLCRNEEAFVHHWQDTEWAHGMMEPVPVKFGHEKPVTH